jgi:hypothetical protein
MTTFFLFRLVDRPGPAERLQRTQQRIDEPSNVGSLLAIRSPQGQTERRLPESYHTAVGRRDDEWQAERGVDGDGHADTP